MREAGCFCCQGAITRRQCAPWSLPHPRDGSPEAKDGHPDARDGLRRAGADLRRERDGLPHVGDGGPLVRDNLLPWMPARRLSNLGLHPPCSGPVLVLRGSHRGGAGLLPPLRGWGSLVDTLVLGLTPQAVGCRPFGDGCRPWEGSALPAGISVPAWGREGRESSTIVTAGSTTVSETPAFPGARPAPLGRRSTVSPNSRSAARDRGELVAVRRERRRDHRERGPFLRESGRVLGEPGPFLSELVRVLGDPGPFLRESVRVHGEPAPFLRESGRVLGESGPGLRDPPRDHDETAARR